MDRNTGRLGARLRADSPAELQFCFADPSSCRSVFFRGRGSGVWDTPMLGLTTGSTKDLTRLIIRAFLGDADGEWGSLGRRRDRLWVRFTIHPCASFAAHFHTLNTTLLAPFFHILSTCHNL
jgi:hypothetical protein